MVRILQRAGDEVTKVVSPDLFRTLPCPTYPEIRLALVHARRRSARIIEATGLTSSTSRPKGRSASGAASLPASDAAAVHDQLSHQVPRISVRARAACRSSWSYAVHAPVSQCRRRLHGGDRVAARRSRGARVPQPPASGRAASTTSCSGRGPAPISACRGRSSSPSGASRSRRTSRPFSKLDLPGSKVVVGDGPARAALSRSYPDAHFLGALLDRSAGRGLCGRGCLRLPEPHRYVRQRPPGGAASGLPVAAFPVTGPKDVVTDPRVGVLDADLAQGGAGGARSVARGGARIRASLQLGGER